MEIKSSHPLDNLTRSNPLSMLEALIPFVDYPMNLALALMIKYQEVRLILNAFNSIDTLSKYGLHNSSSDPMDMLATVLGISPEMMKTLISLMESQGMNFNDFTNTSSFNTMQKQNMHESNSFSGIQHYANYNSTNNNAELSQNNLDDNIRNIFAEYDLLQAAEYNEENEELHANSINDIVENNRKTDEYIINESGKDKINEPEYYI